LRENQKIKVGRGRDEVRAVRDQRVDQLPVGRLAVVVAAESLGRALPVFVAGAHAVGEVAVNQVERFAPGLGPLEEVFVEDLCLALWGGRGRRLSFGKRERRKAEDLVLDGQVSLDGSVGSILRTLREADGGGEFVYLFYACDLVGPAALRHDQVLRDCGGAHAEGLCSLAWFQPGRSFLSGGSSR